MRLAGAMVRILAEDHDPDLVERRQVEGFEPVATLWKDALSLFLLGGEEALELGHVGLAELPAQRLEPACMKLDVRGRHRRPY